MIFLFALSRSPSSFTVTPSSLCYAPSRADLHFPFFANGIPAKFAARSGLIAPHATLISESLKIIARRRLFQLHVAATFVCVRHAGEALRLLIFMREISIKGFRLFLEDALSFHITESLKSRSEGLIVLPKSKTEV